MLANEKAVGQMVDKFNTAAAVQLAPVLTADERALIMVTGVAAQIEPALTDHSKLYFACLGYGLHRRGGPMTLRERCVLARAVVAYLVGRAQ